MSECYTPLRAKGQRALRVSYAKSVCSVAIFCLNNRPHMSHVIIRGVTETLATDQ